MRLSTRSRYGTRMMADLTEHYDEGPIQIGDVAKRQDISVKYLEQLIIPLKKANYIKTVRGPRGGYMLAKPPSEITVGEVVKVLEGEISLSRCIENPETCERSDSCPSRDIWEMATRAMYSELDSITLAEMISKTKPFTD